MEQSAPLPPARKEHIQPRPGNVAQLAVPWSCAKHRQALYTWLVAYLQNAIKLPPRLTRPAMTPHPIDDAKSAGTFFRTRPVSMFPVCDSTRAQRPEGEGASRSRRGRGRRRRRCSRSSEFQEDLSRRRSNRRRWRQCCADMLMQSSGGRHVDL